MDAFFFLKSEGKGGKKGGHPGGKAHGCRADKFGQVEEQAPIGPDWGLGANVFDPLEESGPCVSV
jgi:hypothetical protein